MNNFWKEIMEKLLAKGLYPNYAPDMESWYKQYEYEMESMMNDIKDFYKANSNVGIKISNEAMAQFIIYTEYVHIGNYIVAHEINKSQITSIATTINNYLHQQEVKK